MGGFYGIVFLMGGFYGIVFLMGGFYGLVFLIEVFIYSSFPHRGFCDTIPRCLPSCRSAYVLRVSWVPLPFMVNMIVGQV